MDQITVRLLLAVRRTAAWGPGESYTTTCAATPDRGRVTRTREPAGKPWDVPAARMVPDEAAVRARTSNSGRHLIVMVEVYPLRTSPEPTHQVQRAAHGHDIALVSE